MSKLISDALSKGIFKLGDDYPSQTWVSSGSLVLDYAMGGGYPVGKIIEIYGEPSAGKSLLSLKAEALVTQSGKYVIHCDLEGNYTTNELNDWRKSLGVDLDYIYQIPPCPAEDVIDNSVMLLEELKDTCGLMVVDSVGVLESRKTLEKDAEDKAVGELARFLSRWVRKLIQVNKYCPILMLNQTYNTIGGYHSSKITKGGGALKFGSHLRLEVRGKPMLDTENEMGGTLGQEIQVLVKKNKVGVPNRQAMLYFDMITKDFDRIAEVVSLGLATKVITSKPPMYSFIADGQEVKVKGREHLKDMLREDSTLTKKLIEQIYA